MAAPPATVATPAASAPSTAMSAVAQVSPACAIRGELVRRVRAERSSAATPCVRDLLLGGGRTEALGSNNWVVDGTLTASGKPLLANDPHLGTHVPSLWYLAHMSAGDFDVDRRDASRRAGRRASAATDSSPGAKPTSPPTSRISIASASIRRASCAEFRGAQEPMRIIPETIAVKGGEPIQLDVRITRHGPLVSDAINANNAASTAEPEAAGPRAARVPLDGARRTGRHDRCAFLRLNEARNWTEFTAALRDFVVPSQNFVYADVDGHIGYYAPGHIPIRARGDGSPPADGWTGDDGVDRLDSVRRAAARLRSARALHRHRQQPAGAARLSAPARRSSIRSRIARSASPICCADSRG